MRPLTLNIDGLRSYRRPATLDFSDIDLLAIVGDTGAGKSSILEAITYALYSAATWTGQPGELIADGTRTMKVALTFEADGKRWQVTRSMSRDGYPPPVHRLLCEDDGVAINGRSDVNAAIERLVGLDCKAFLQSVVLPQGRFAELLKATPTDRGKILQNIFRVDELIAARDVAGQLLDRWEPRHEALIAARSHYLPDPGAAAADAAGRRSAAESRKQSLDDLRTFVTGLQSTASETEREASELDALIETLREPALRGGAAELGKLTVLAAELADARQTLEERRLAARALEKAARDQLDEATREGVGLTHLTKAEAELEALARDLSDVADGVDQAAADTGDLDAAGQRATRIQEAAQAASERATHAEAQAAEATKAAAETTKALDAARVALAAYRDRQEQRDSIAEELRQCCDDLEKRRADAERLAIDAQEAATRAATAEHRLRELERSAAAAAASHDCKSGDPCPVCNRELPASWRPPTSPKLETARRECEQAQNAKEKARTDADTAAAHHEAATAHEKGRRAALRRAERATSEAYTRLAEATQITATQLKSKIAADDAVLAKVTTAAVKAEATRDKLASTAFELRNNATAAAGEAKAAHKEVADRERSLKASLEKLAKTCANLRGRAAQLPESVRPEIAEDIALDLKVTAEERAVALGTTRATDALEVVRVQLAALKDVEAAAASARSEREGLESRLEADQVRWQAEVAEPTAAAARRVDRLADRLGHALARLDHGEAPQRPAGSDAAELMTWATAIEKAADNAITALAKQAKSGRDHAARARQQIADRLAKHGLTDAAALDSATVEAATEAQVAATEEKAARAQIPVVAALDDRITRGRPFLSDLRAVYDLLGNSRYIGYLMHRRQRALLGVATRLLGDMSAGRFGFSEDFQVIDCYSGQPRSTSTLSGGESFLASMALALAMVELAGRAGGRLDSLFLDEGFGSLDAKTLDIAIDTLEGRAKAGRLVAVISHVKAVAERIDNVLAVSYNPTDGSAFRMLTPAERSGLVQDDAVAAVAGLLA